MTNKQSRITLRTFRYYLNTLPNKKLERSELKCPIYLTPFSSERMFWFLFFFQFYKSVWPSNDLKEQKNRLLFWETRLVHYFPGNGNKVSNRIIIPVKTFQRKKISFHPYHQIFSLKKIFLFELLHQFFLFFLIMRFGSEMKEQFSLTRKKVGKWNPDYYNGIILYQGRIRWFQLVPKLSIRVISKGQFCQHFRNSFCTSRILILFWHR